MPAYIAEVVSDDPFVINVRDQSNPSTVYVGRIKPRRVVCVRILREIFARHPDRVKYEMKPNTLLVIVWIQYSVEGIQVRDPERLDIECYAGNLHSRDIMELKRDTAALEKQHGALVQDIRALVAGSKDRSVDRECIGQILVERASERAQLLKRLEASDALVAKLEQEVNRSKDATRALREFCGDMIDHSFICAMMDYVIDTRGKCKVPITVVGIDCKGSADSRYTCLPNGGGVIMFNKFQMMPPAFVHVAVKKYNKRAQSNDVLPIYDYHICDNAVFIIHGISQDASMKTIEIHTDTVRGVFVILCVDNKDTMLKLSSVEVHIHIDATGEVRKVAPLPVARNFDDTRAAHWVKFIPKELTEHSEMHRLSCEYDKMLALEKANCDE